VTDTSAAHLLDVIQEHSVTRTFIVPTLLAAILQQLQKTGRRAPAIRTITYGASVMSEGLLKDAIALLGCEFGQYYGMTEAGGTVTYLSASDHDLQRPHLLKSVGRPQCGMAVEIRDAAGRVLAATQPGEIWVRTPTLMAGYWRLPEATQAAIVDGWYRTGDGGYLDKDGYLYLTDRIRDMIVSGGENVYPAQVEEVLRKHPAVREAAVVGVPDKHWGERVVGVVERRDGMKLEADELIAFARQSIAGYKCPKTIHFVDALPRTAMGKVQRAIVRGQATQLSSSERS
jgi:acyl-CoA synthetase (AMP-forming)/AMP-acid ligase II